MNKWHKVRQLTWRERWVLIQALIALPTLGLWLRWWSCRATLTRSGTDRFFLPSLESQSAGATAEALLRQGRSTARLVRLAATYGLYRAGCLPQSLVLRWLLRRQGIAGDLRIGVRKESGRFEAHAWVEHQGRVLNDGDDVCRRFAPLHI